jgi:hypothetical protein
MLQPCGALRLNEHCRGSGGYAVAGCRVGTADYDGSFEFKRVLGEKTGSEDIKAKGHLKEGSFVTQVSAARPWRVQC